MKKKIYKICGVALALVLVFSLSFGAFVPVKQVSADPGEVAWSSIANPGGTLRTGLNLADVDVGPIAVTPDGETLFAAANCETAIAGVGDPDVGLPWALLQSTDGGHNWTATGLIKNPGPITGIAISPYFATDGTMYVAAVSPTTTVAAVFRSTDSGTTFTELKGVPPEIGKPTSTLVINSIAMWPASPYPYIMVGTDTDVWVLQDMPFGAWMDQEVNNAGPVNILEVAFAPDFAATNFIWAVTDTGVVTATNSPGAWGTILSNTPNLFGPLFAPAEFTITWNTSDVEGSTVTLTAGAAGATVTYDSPGAITGTPAPGTIGAGDTFVFTDTTGNQAAVIQTVDVTAGSVTAVAAPTAGSSISIGIGIGFFTSADIAFPENYSSTTSPYLWVGLNGNAGADNGGVWRVRGLVPPGPSQAIPQLAAVDIRSIAVSGSMASATIIAGGEDLPAIYQSTNGGLTWPPTAVLKQPTGANTTYVVMAPDFAASGLAYVGTSDAVGWGSAFQVTRNTGTSWNQTGLVDVPTVVAGASVLDTIDDIAVVSVDTVFMVANGTDLWKTTDATATAPIWERILTNTTVTVPMHGLKMTNITFVANSPEFATDSVVYATDSKTNVVKSTDGGDIFTAMGPPGANITALCVVDATFAFTGAIGDVYRTDDGGYSWLKATTPPATDGLGVISFAISPDYANDSTMLVGTDKGTVERSKNSGATFTIVKAAIDGVTNTYVAFDPEYADNSLIYAAGDAVIARYDFTATALGWVDIDKTMAGVGVGVDAVDADEILIRGAAATADEGTITVLTGSILVTVPVDSGATIAGVTAGDDKDGTLTITAGMGAVAWSTGATDTLAIKATANGTSGTWLSTTTELLGGPSAKAELVEDVNENVTFATGPSTTDTNNPFSLPDAAVVGTGAASEISGLLTSPDGTIYGSNFLANLGVERSLNPRKAPSDPTFERVIDELPAKATLAGLWLVVDPALDVIGSKNVLFSVNTAKDQIVTYTDTLATTVVLTAPADGTVYPREAAVTMVWEELTGADTYQWQIATDSKFKLVVSEGSSGYTSDSSGLLAAGRTYYWRVRVADDGVGDPLLSRWSNAPAYESSAHWTFTTFLGKRPWHPFDPMSGVSPSPGATDIPVKPTFQWNGADWATTYDLELADNSAFTGAIKKTLSTTAWTCDPALDYSTTYYWKVKAVSDVTESEWSDVGVFTTVAEVVPPAKVYSCPQCGLEFSTEAALQAHWDKFHAPPTPVKPITPAYIWAIIGVGALLVVAVIVLIVRTRRVA